MSEQEGGKKIASKCPWQVWVVGGVIQAGFDDEDRAKWDAESRNAEAEKFGIKARYETRHAP